MNSGFVEGLMDTSSLSKFTSNADSLDQDLPTPADLEHCKCPLHDAEIVELFSDGAAGDSWVPELLDSWVAWANGNPSSVAYYVAGAATVAMTLAWLAGGTRRRR